MRATMKKVILLLALLLFTISGLIDLSYAKKVKPPVADKDEIKGMAKRDFETIVALWKDEDYERLYEYGRLSSHTKVSKEAFSKRMKNKRWKLMCCGDGAKEIEAIYKSPASVYIKAIMGYKSVVKEMKRHDTFKLTFEDGKWKIDLSQVLRVPKGER